MPLFRSLLGQGPTSASRFAPQLSANPSIYPLILGSCSRVPGSDLAGVRAGVDLLEVSVELTLQRPLVFLASGAMAGRLYVECDCNTGGAFACYRNIPEPFRDPQRRFFHASQSPIAHSPRVGLRFQFCITDQRDPLV